jgi:chloride channel protein, CIC family
LKVERRLIFDTLLLGVAGALSAQLFMFLLGKAQGFFLGDIAGYYPPKLPSEGGLMKEIIGPYGMWLVPLATTLGGLISGLLVYMIAPEAEGHGTGTVVRAFHRAGGFIRARVSPVKAVASAITIGSGGSAGREGPIALVCAGVGSYYATKTKRSNDERRLLILIGMSAGLSAIFRSPIGTAFFTIEVLYSDMEFDAAALLYTMLASLTAYAVNGLFVGYQPLFHVPTDLPPPVLRDYHLYILLGVASGVVAAFLPNMFYGLRDAFKRLPVPEFAKPAIGGLGVGLIAMSLPQVLGGGYGWIQEAINGNIAIWVMVILLFAKLTAFCLTVSSGGSGGVFAPTIFVGAMLGGVMANVFGQLPAPFVVVGMAAVLGGAARVPIGTMLMVTEMTRGYHMLVPAALAVVLSYIVQQALTKKSKYVSLYEAQVPKRSDSPAHQREHLEAAFGMLYESAAFPPEMKMGLDLNALASSGVPLELPDGKRLSMGVLRAGSVWDGMPAFEVCHGMQGEGADLTAVIRKNKSMSPHTEEPLRAGDRLFIITTKDVWKRISENF